MPGSRRPGLRAAAVAVMVGPALLLGAGSASAHTKLDSSDPADGALVATAPSRVTLAFNQEMQAEFSTITVIGPDGAAWQTGRVTSAGKSVTTMVRPLGPAGRYDIGYRVLSEDGHPVAGAIAFTMTAPGPGATAPPTAATPASGDGATAAPPPAAAPEANPAASAEASDSADAPAWTWLLGGLLVVAAGVVAALMSRRRQ